MIDIRRGPQQLFHAARPGTSADNDAWAERKARVARFGASSYLVGLRSLAKGAPFETRRADLPPDRFAAHGGSLPIIVTGAGVIGSVTVSGLASEVDHALAVRR